MPAIAPLVVPKLPPSGRFWTNTVPVPTSTTGSPSTSPPCECARTFNLQCEQGATLSSQITITLDGNPVDVTGGTFQFTAKIDPTLPDTDPTVVTVDWQETTSPTLGITWLTIPAEVTAGMQVTSYFYQIRFVSSGNVVTPLIKGSLTIIQPISARY